MAVAVMTLALTLTCAAASRLPHHLRFQSEAFVQHKGIHGNTPLVVCQDGHCFVPDPGRASLQKWVATATVVSAAAALIAYNVLVLQRSTTAVQAHQP